MGKLKNGKELLNIARELSAWIKGEKEDGLRLDCMHGLGVYTTTINVESKFARWIQKIGSKSREFSSKEVYDVKLYALKPILKPIKDAIHRYEDRIAVDLTRGLEHEMFRLEVFYRMQEDWLEGLVHSRSSPEPLRDALKYHLSAQLKDPPSLGKGFGEVDVEEFPVVARVHIQEDINTALPVLETFRKIRKIENEILSDTDPHHGMQIIGLQKKRHRLRKKLERENPTSVLRELRLLLRPTSFSDYLRTELDFRFHRCRWGTEMFKSVEALSLPKNIEVVTRTDLNLDRPTSKGVLLFKSGRFSEDVNAIVEKTKRGRRRRK